MRDSRGKRVGRCKEWVKVVSDSEVDVRVLAMRHKDKGYIPPERQALKPERVLAYRQCLCFASSWHHNDCLHGGTMVYTRCCALEAYLCTRNQHSFLSAYM